MDETQKPKKITTSPVGTKGYTGNPNGRPKKNQTITDLLNKYLDETTFGESKINGKQVLVQKMFQMAAQGDLAALKYCIDRIDGTPRQMVETKQIDDDGNAIIPAIQVTFVDPDAK